MTTEGLQQAIASTRAVLADVDRSQFDLPTPCASWNVQALVDHIIGGQAFFAAAVRGETPPEGDWTAGDLVETYDAQAAEAVAAFSADGVLDAMLELPFGTMPGSAFLGIATMDTFAHGWDLARAIGSSTDLDPGLAEALLPHANFPDAMRGPEGAPFGPVKEAPAGATAADRLAAVLGRDVA